MLRHRRRSPLRFYSFLGSALLILSAGIYLLWPHARVVLVIEGDSQSTGYFNDFPKELVASVDSSPTTINRAVGGERISDMLPDFDSEIASQFNPKASVCVLHLFAGTNDFGLDNATADEVFDRLRQLASKGRAAGFRVVVTTLPRRAWKGTKDFPADPPDLNNRIDAFNERLRRDYRDFADRLVDYAAHESIANPDQATSDGVHLTRAAAKEAAELSAATINELLVPQ